MPSTHPTCHQLIKRLPFLLNLSQQIATEFKLRTTDVIDRIHGLEAMGRLTGVMDERGKVRRPWLCRCLCSFTCLLQRCRGTVLFDCKLQTAQVLCCVIRRAFDLPQQVHGIQHQTCFPGSAFHRALASA